MTEPQPRPTSFRFWEIFSPEELRMIQSRIASVIEEKGRQPGLFPAAIPSDKNATLGTILSPSQVKTFLDCSARWWFQYGLGLPNPKSGSLIRGIAVHKLVEWWL